MKYDEYPPPIDDKDLAEEVVESFALQEPKYPFLWDGSLKETLQAVPVGICAELDKCRELFDKEYECVIKFTQPEKWVTENVWCNGRFIMHRKKKFAPVTFGKGVQLLEGTPTPVGGSNSYPTPYFKEKYCILKFISKGIPILSHYAYKWTIEYISIKPKP